jgi:hypothetical protein
MWWRGWNLKPAAVVSREDDAILLKTAAPGLIVWHWAHNPDPRQNDASEFKQFVDLRVHGGSGALMARRADPRLAWRQCLGMLNQVA